MRSEPAGHSMADGEAGSAVCKSEELSHGVDGIRASDLLHQISDLAASD